MTGGWEDAKLRELQAKTDRQLLSLVNGRLESGFQSDAAGNHAQAERAYAEANRLLPAIHNLPAGARTRLEGRLAELREVLASTCV